VVLLFCRTLDIVSGLRCVGQGCLLLFAFVAGAFFVTLFGCVWVSNVIYFYSHCILFWIVCFLLLVWGGCCLGLFACLV